MGLGELGVLESWYISYFILVVDLFSDVFKSYVQNDDWVGLPYASI